MSLSINSDAVLLVPMSSEGLSESSRRARGSDQGISMMHEQLLSSDQLDPLTSKRATV